jgi:SAM-dependent methyltransferase
MPSAYQRHSRRYYAALSRAYYAEGTERRALLTRGESGRRYSSVTVEGVRNLDSLIRALRRLMGARRSCRGVDYGCGAHCFIDRASRNWGWDVAGYDADAASIAMARRLYPASGGRYVRRDLLAQGIPVPAGSQDFVFSNAVFQHFGTAELRACLKEIARVLRPGGVLLTVFKIRVPDWGAFTADTGIRVRAAGGKEEGRILVEDPLAAGMLGGLSARRRSRLDGPAREGWRLFHVYRVPEVLRLASRFGLRVAPSVEFAPGRKARGVVTYRSGRGIPAAAVFLRKTAGGKAED